jgi:hypothetical protein
MALISKNEDIKNTSVVLGYHLLKKLDKAKDGRLLIFDVAELMAKDHQVTWKQFNYTLIFLFYCGTIDFQAPYIIKK